MSVSLAAMDTNEIIILVTLCVAMVLGVVYANNLWNRRGKPRAPRPDPLREVAERVMDEAFAASDKHRSPDRSHDVEPLVSFDFVLGKPEPFGVSVLQVRHEDVPRDVAIRMLKAYHEFNSDSPWWSVNGHTLRLVSAVRYRFWLRSVERQARREVV